jgi:hypothetical protein
MKWLFFTRIGAPAHKMEGWISWSWTTLPVWKVCVIRASPTILLQCPQAEALTPWKSPVFLRVKLRTLAGDEITWLDGGSQCVFWLSARRRANWKGGCWTGWHALFRLHISVFTQNKRQWQRGKFFSGLPGWEASSSGMSWTIPRTSASSPLLLAWVRSSLAPSFAFAS